MQGTIVQASNLDSVHIEVLGEGRSLTIPTDLILDVDRVMRAALIEEEAVDIDVVEDDDTGKRGWQASLGNVVTAIQNSPWNAMRALANELEQRG